MDRGRTAATGCLLGRNMSSPKQPTTTRQWTGSAGSVVVGRRHSRSTLREMFLAPVGGNPVPAAPNGVGTSALPARRSGTKLASSAPPVQQHPPPPSSPPPCGCTAPLITESPGGRSGYRVAPVRIPADGAEILDWCHGSPPYSPARLCLGDRSTSPLHTGCLAYSALRNTLSPKSWATRVRRKAVARQSLSPALPRLTRPSFHRRIGRLDGDRGSHSLNARRPARAQTQAD